MKRTRLIVVSGIVALLGVLAICFLIKSPAYSAELARERVDDTNPPPPVEVVDSGDCSGGTGSVGEDGNYIPDTNGGNQNGSGGDNPNPGPGDEDDNDFVDTYLTWENGDMIVNLCISPDTYQFCYVDDIVEWQPTITYCEYLRSKGIDCKTGQPITTNPVNPSWSPNPDIDAPPGCSLIGPTEYGMTCYPTCAPTPAEGGVACLAVRREPYPRGMVSIPNVFVVNGPYSKEGGPVGCVDANTPNPLYRNRQVRVVWEMDLGIPPAWFFDERPWNIQKGISNQAFGFQVEHTYETSSYSTFEGDKPAIGPSLTNELLPAYLVRLDTWWIGSIVREWDEWEWYEEFEEYACNPNDLDPVTGKRRDANCGDDGVGRRLKPGFPEYRLAGHRTAKEAVDLRQWGWPTAELYSRNAWEPRQSVAGIPPQYLCRYIPTPILEAQAVLTGP